MPGPGARAQPQTNPVRDLTQRCGAREARGPRDRQASTDLCPAQLDHPGEEQRRGDVDPPSATAFEVWASSNDRTTCRSAGIVSMKGILTSGEDILKVMTQNPPEVVAEIVAQWRRERPDLDPSPILVIGQMARLTQLYEPLLRPPFAQAGLGSGDFDVLAALRRTGEPFTLTPGQLSKSLLVTTGAITKRLDRLQTRGLLQRAVSPDDSRGRLVTLTPAGANLVDDLIAVHLANEARLLAGLSAEEREQLAAMLARLAETVDDVEELTF